ncbi:GNAT family N-acetyltransferase [Actinospica durhamensis]|uniref:GNAT family N-acetyltransferase n=1 Tax=Actinospica durhamensis TaxID=1508375 RepID=A0A941EPF4_9ACTN|nr:GNAT family N-acetyltransferase [Actinospica durhamensis]MBR7832749.1 GNAT family N-acetyltransferase [Actinospica durhamensis]
MPQLIPPHPRFHASFLSAIEEFRAAGPLSDWAAHVDYEAVRGQEGFAAYVRDLDLRRVASAERSVPESTLFWIEGEEFLGRIAVRHRLNERLEVMGGHIGYAIRPGAQGKGHATALLRAVLPLAYAVGIDDALLTTDPDNHGSRRVIEKCGGRLVKQGPDHCYYRLRTGGAAEV